MVNDFWCLGCWINDIGQNSWIKLEIHMVFTIHGSIVLGFIVRKNRRPFWQEVTWNFRGTYSGWTQMVSSNGSMVWVKGKH